MSKKRRKPNPVYMRGVEKGIEIGKNKTFEVLKEVLIDDLFQQKGIGPVTQQKIADAIGTIPRKIQVSEEDMR